MTITTPLNDPNSSLVEGWTALWNGDLSQAATICAEQVTVHFGGRAIAEAGDHVMDASGLADLIGAFRSTRPGLTYRVVEAHTTEQWGYCVWDAGRGDLNVGGIDTFRFIRGRISHVYSVTAERPIWLETHGQDDDVRRLERLHAITNHLQARFTPSRLGVSCCRDALEMQRSLEIVTDSQTTALG